MEAVILVGGEGTRLRPLNQHLPKALVPVLNRPFLSHMIEHLSKHGVNNITLAAGHFSKLLDDFVKDYSNPNLCISVEPEPLGTAGAVRYSVKNPSETFLVLNGDIFSSINISELLQFHNSKKSEVTIALTFVEDPSSFGVVQTNQHERINAFVEKPQQKEDISHWVNAGIYVINPNILENIPFGQFYMFETGLFPNLLKQGYHLYGYKHEGFWIDMGTLPKYFNLNSELLFNFGNDDSIKYGVNCDISETAVLEGPILLGDNVSIGSDSKLIGPVILGNDCYVGGGVEIKNSLIWENVTIDNDSIVNGVIIGSDEVLPSRSEVSNVAIAENNFVQIYD